MKPVNRVEKHLPGGKPEPREVNKAIEFIPCKSMRVGLAGQNGKIKEVLIEMELSDVPFPVIYCTSNPAALRAIIADLTDALQRLEAKQ